jgi:hypothetical protein
MKSFDTRETMVNDLIPKNGIYCEIGIFKGEFADQLTKILNPTELHMLDLFDGITCSGNVDGNNVVHTNMKDEYTRLLTLSHTIPCIKIHAGDSSIVLKTFPDNYFDMIYIDGDHSYNGVKKDITVAFNKIKNGGYIMGHDYEMNMAKARNVYDFGVKRAVDEFCATNGQTVCAKGYDGCVSFAIHISK